MSINVRAECHTDINTLMRMACYSEWFAPQLFKFQRTCAGMEPKTRNLDPTFRQEIVQEDAESLETLLDSCSIEVLKMVLLVLRARQN